MTYGDGTPADATGKRKSTKVSIILSPKAREARDWLMAVRGTNYTDTIAEALISWANLQKAAGWEVGVDESKVAEIVLRWPDGREKTVLFI